MITRTCAATLSLVVAAALAACSNGDDGPLGEAQNALSSHATAGKLLFDNALAGTNGRSCATCHVESEHTALRPANVAARLSDPADPLFNGIDADDPAATPLQFTHLQAGLVRVKVTMADNLDLVDAAGNVVTGPDRTVQLWRGVPTVENTAYTAPYQYDGRVLTLPDQALQALLSHSQLAHDPPQSDLDDIADYERTVFSSPAAATVAAALAAGEDPPDVQPSLGSCPEAAAGEVLFNRACAACHGGATGIQFVNQAAHDVLFPFMEADGSIKVTPPGPGGIVLPRYLRTGHHSDRYLNIGISGGTYLGQVGLAPNLTGVDFPHYRVRFYTDASRTQKLFDLPPPPPALSTLLVPQEFSTDPGRCLISGDPADFEGFDIPQLRGVANTAPYFHDNSAPTLMDVLDIYSRFVLPQIPALSLPRVLPPEGPNLPPESLSPVQKQQLLAYLELL